MSLRSFLARNAQRAQSKMRMVRAHRARNANVRLTEQLTEFYGTHPISKWQQDEIDKIRKAYEEKNRDLAIAHDIASSRLSDKFMQLELDYIRGSHEFKEKNPGLQWVPSGIDGFFSSAFWYNLRQRAKSLGVQFTYGQETARQ